jgi:hypothetical protein
MRGCNKLLSLRILYMEKDFSLSDFKVPKGLTIYTPTEEVLQAQIPAVQDLLKPAYARRKELYEQTKRERGHSLSHKAN